MEHTRAKIRKHRGLIHILLVLLVVWLLEPGLDRAADACRDLFEHLTGGR